MVAECTAIVPESEIARDWPLWEKWVHKEANCNHIVPICLITNNSITQLMSWIDTFPPLTLSIMPPPQECIHIDLPVLRLIQPSSTALYWHWPSCTQANLVSTLSKPLQSILQLWICLCPWRSSPAKSKGTMVSSSLKIHHFYCFYYCNQCLF